MAEPEAPHGAEALIQLLMTQQRAIDFLLKQTEAMQSLRDDVATLSGLVLEMSKQQSTAALIRTGGADAVRPLLMALMPKLGAQVRKAVVDREREQIELLAGVEQRVAALEKRLTKRAAK